MRVPRNFRWAAERSREVWADEGLRGLSSRAGGYARRRVFGGTPAQRLPLAVAGSTFWPQSVVMIAASSPQQCFHYRVQQKREACRILGVPFGVIEPESPEVVTDAVQLASILIIYRLGTDPSVLAGIAQARRLGIPIVFETDDAVYRRDLLETDPNLRLVPRSLRRSVIKGADQYQEVARMADYALASTEGLAEDLGRLVRGRAFVVENGIDSAMLNTADGIKRDPAPPRRAVNRIRIGYGSGSQAHDFDLALAASGLARVLDDHPHVELFLMGPVRIPERLQPYRDRIERIRAVNYSEYLRQLASCDISIAPLADLAFNDFKSQVKYLESALVGVPFAASPTTYRRYVADGRTGLVVEAGEWGKALTRLVEDEELRALLAEQAREDVRRFEIANLPAQQMAQMLETLA